MTDHIAPSIEDDASLPLPLPAEPSSGLFAGFTEVTWAVVGTGFLLGILIGSIFIVGRGASSGAGAAGSIDSQLNSPVVSEEPSTAPVSVVNDQHDLSAERDKLRRELEAEKLRLEVESLRSELAGLQSSTETDEAPTLRPARASEGRRPATQPVAAMSEGAATLAHWNQLNAIILQEAAMRTAPAGGVTASNAGGFLEARMQAAEFAANSIRELETDGVDRNVLSLSESLATWYQDGRDVAEQGLHLLTKASAEERKGSMGKNYQAAERSQSTAVNAINSEGERVRQAMTQKYNLSFPPLN